MYKKKIVVITIFIAALLTAAGIISFKIYNKDKAVSNPSATVVPWDIDIPEEDKPVKGGGKYFYLGILP